YALALVLELRNTYLLPAYIWHLKIKPGNSNIRDIPPTAAPYVRDGERLAQGSPERYRTYDEAAVLVGNAPTINDAKKLLFHVRPIPPKVMDGLPSIVPWRKGTGLSRALITTNPLAAAQNLYPGREGLHHGKDFDPFVAVSALERSRKVD